MSSMSAKLKMGKQLRWSDGTVSTNFLIEEERANLVLVELFDGQLLGYIEPLDDTDSDS
jgi:hypothetical protein